MRASDATALLLVLLALSSCSCEDSCFVAGTLVDTPDGPRPIETLVPGDVVWSVNVTSGTKHPARVEAVHTGTGVDFHAVRVNGVTTHPMTANHPVLDARTQRFVPVSQLEDGARLMDASGQVTALERRSRAWELPQTVYNLQVTGPDHTFVADGVVVHNKSYARLNALYDAALCACLGDVVVTSGCSGDVDAGMPVCCMIHDVEQVVCVGRGVRDARGVDRIGAAHVDLSRNAITNVDSLGESLDTLGGAPWPLTKLNLWKNPIADIDAFSVAMVQVCMGRGTGAVTLDLRDTLLGPEDQAAVERMRTAGCEVLTSP